MVLRILGIATVLNQADIHLLLINPRLDTALRHLISRDILLRILRNKIFHPGLNRNNLGNTVVQVLSLRINNLRLSLRKMLTIRLRQEIILLLLLRDIPTTHLLRIIHHRLLLALLNLRSRDLSRTPGRSRAMEINLVPGLVLGLFLLSTAPLRLPLLLALRLLAE